MADISFKDVEAGLKQSPVFVCDVDDLGLSYDEKFVAQVLDTATDELRRQPTQEDGPRHEARAMSHGCNLAGVKLLRPVINHIFAGPDLEAARAGWTHFGINYYETGDLFYFHRDFEEPTPAAVVILSLSGVRLLKVDSHPIELTPAKIAFLDGNANPFHTAECIDGPSVSVVADVPCFPA